jgi:type IV pilus assembly protein PilC
MSGFSYMAIDSGGDETKGTLIAVTLENAVAELKARGLFPTEVSAESDATAPAMTGKSSPAHSSNPVQVRRSVSLRLPFFRPVTPQELMLFTRQLTTLLRVGMPLLRGLETLARHEHNARFREIIADLAAHIRSGGSLSEGLARHPRVFDWLYLSMVRSGEAGGLLDTVLDRQARFLEKSLQLRGKVKAALVYPLVVLTVALAIVSALLVFVVPQFKKIFADMLKGAPLPPLT